MDWKYLIAPYAVIGAVAAWRHFKQSPAPTALVNPEAIERISTPRKKAVAASQPDPINDHTTQKYRTLQPGNRVISKGPDDTKRKSLQPAKQKPIPKGYKLVTSTEDAKGATEISEGTFVTSHAPAPKRDYSYKFFGSQLLVGHKTILTGLGKSLHHLEITPQDMAFIDGKNIHLHPNDMEDIKAAVLKSQNEKV